MATPSIKCRLLGDGSRKSPLLSKYYNIHRYDYRCRQYMENEIPRYKTVSFFSVLTFFICKMGIKAPIS